MLNWPWTVGPMPSGYQVIDANGIVLAHVYRNAANSTHPRRLFRDETPVPGFQYHYIGLSHVTTRIWIEAVKRPDGSKPYTAERGLLLMARLGSPDGEILVEGVHNALCEACRVLMSRGISGSFETRKPGIDYPCMIGDIEKTAGLTVYEPDDGTVHFGRWRPFDQNAPSRSAVLAAAREDDGAGRRVAADMSASLRLDRIENPEAAE